MSQTPTSFRLDRAFAQELDAHDPLAAFRDRFHIPKQADGRDHLYMCGNSLGLQPKSVRAFVEQELSDWEKLGVEGHIHARNPWLPYHEFLTASMAKVVGGQQDEVVVMNSLTVNLHLLMVSFYRPTATRHKIIIEADAFPSDRYAVISQLQFHGFDPKTSLVELRSKSGHPVIPTEEILEVIAREGDSVALVMLGGVNYYSGQAFEMEKITRAGHAVGAKVGFDLAHGAGNLLLKLHEWGPDFACWCGYKYLNSGPGGLSGVFIHNRHATDASIPRFAGWWGHNKANRFKMPPYFEPLPGAEGWQLSNPPILALAALRASLEIFEEAGMAALRAKSEQLTAYLEWLIHQKNTNSNIRIITPSDPAQRGCQLSLQTLSNGRAIFDRLTAAGVIADWREPDVIRIAPVPLYNRFADAWDFVDLLTQV
ncbi:MAG TPA: kynureninase [Bacteroidia bacterium]|nr:kynureninase [Bacteroidia bacterium]